VNLADYFDTPDWMLHAACRGMPSDLFFPTVQGPADRRAHRICAGCAVRAECLDYALSYSAHDDYGIYAGTNAQQRRRMRRRVA
jgi:WhiB family redox-sensing transcriptional regulator